MSDTNDFEDLMAAWLDHRELPAKRCAELLQRLRDDAEFRSDIAAEIQMQGLTRTVQSGEPRWLLLEELLTQANAPATEPLEDAVIRQIKDLPQRVFDWARFLRIGFATACVVLAFFLGRSIDGPAQVSVDDSSEGTFESIIPPVAVIARTAEAQWKNGESPRNPGSMLSPGRIHLESGMAQIDFFGGAHVILEGPAELELLSPGEALLHSGSAHCRVTEHGKGFRLSPPGMKVTDLGTSFGLRVPKQGEPELHVLDGKVIVETAGTEPRELNASDAVRLNDTQLTAAEYSPKLFPEENELTRRERQAMTTRSVEWWDQTLKWQHEPETLLHYTLVSDVYQHQRIENHAPEADGMSHGMVIGGRWAEGRWPWKRALEFRRPADRVLLGLPGEYRQISIAKWLRVDAFTQPKNVLLKSKSAQRGTTRIYADAQRSPGQIRWELDQDGRMHFRIATQGDDWANISTPRLLNDAWIGNWVMMGLTFDSKTGEAVHYWNGQAVAREKLDAPPIAFEFLELGNPHLESAEMRRSNRYGFFGAIDELMISKRVLRDAEMKQFFEAGKPAS
ncbi:MAG: hypothetical protein CMO80_12115 [Verrucomicrobiales bacterium]|nr:hypothetical protein [Verrucomicrobiales bacterium]